MRWRSIRRIEQQKFSTQVVRFLDGSEQRFPGYGATLQRWVIRLDLLDEGELTNLQQFFESEGGRAGNFRFTDPFDGRCTRIAALTRISWRWSLTDHRGGKTQVTIRENRS